MNIEIKLKKLGKKKVLSIVLTLDCSPSSLQELIEACVRSEVRRYNEKRRESELADTGHASLTSFLSSQQISDQLEHGKVSFGDITNKTIVDENKAIEDAILAFKDGLFLVFLDDQELATLNSLIRLTESTNLTFVKMVFLTGTHW
ncbi:hypothetical protein ISG33_11330 [Glaciecola sp. MH2013]|uniref:hypothetical protein n=1 Tax=Glaciecola sp. MH2013 TaxID=2785524 RepID=UPI00189D0307|nr:hypothetical protein [Glaciecola sp. MH2013]MBF7073992.1 hypothetical protein [Glaciecola sp. MH2013]